MTWSFKENTRKSFKVLNLTNREPEGLWNEIKEIIKDEYENSVPKTKKPKEANQMSEQEIANKRRVTKTKDLRKELNEELQRHIRRDKKQHYNAVVKKHSKISLNSEKSFAIIVLLLYKHLLCRQYCKWIICNSYCVSVYRNYSVKAF